MASGLLPPIQPGFDISNSNTGIKPISYQCLKTHLWRGDDSRNEMAELNTLRSMGTTLVRLCNSCRRGNECWKTFSRANECVYGI
ncbi:CIC_collapsed_G0027320.mRNA.1.CDS.1 [Saccharomyces cerevisiae]|nr:CIC_collapsed_G0027320.mRNA.1.CDS.1 [Saccharomyces cerevisiae]